MRKVLVVVAHPDDEILGCGGAIAEHVRRGDEVTVLLMTQGVTGRRDSSLDGVEQISKLRACTQEVKQILGIKSLAYAPFKDQRLDRAPLLEITRGVEDAIEAVSPSWVYTHHAGDLNKDHRIVHEAVATACRPQPESPVSTLLFFETLSSTEWQPAGSAPQFVPNWFVDIEESISKKIDAMNAYGTEMREAPHPRSVQGMVALAQWRGMSVGLHYAEAFMLGRRRGL